MSSRGRAARRGDPVRGIASSRREGAPRHDKLGQANARHSRWAGRARREAEQPGAISKGEPQRAPRGREANKSQHSKAKTKPRRAPAAQPARLATPGKIAGSKLPRNWRWRFMIEYTATIVRPTRDCQTAHRYKTKHRSPDFVPLTFVTRHHTTNPVGSLGIFLVLSIALVLQRSSGSGLRERLDRGQARA